MCEHVTHYLSHFSKLRRNHHAAHGNAPHKPVLLLTVLRAIDVGIIKDNFIPIAPELAAIFAAIWDELVPPNTWQEKMSYPFRYLVTDGLWEMIKDGRVVTGEEVGVPRQIFQLIIRIDGGRFAPDLWDLLLDPVAHISLHQQLLITYFSGHECSELTANAALAAQADRLRAQASAKFRSKPPITDDAGMFVRHSLFPMVVGGLDRNTCAVCRRDDRMANQSIVDAAHIMPFAEFHNDDPRNGLALCKNHHWAFDVGAIEVSSDFKVIVSKKHVSALPLVEQR